MHIDDEEGAAHPVRQPFMEEIPGQGFIIPGFPGSPEHGHAVFAYGLHVFEQGLLLRVRQQIRVVLDIGKGLKRFRPGCRAQAQQNTGQDQEADSLPREDPSHFDFHAASSFPSKKGTGREAYSLCARFIITSSIIVASSIAAAQP